jgi:acyl-homoserine-lactone acylase
MKILPIWFSVLGAFWAFGQVNPNDVEIIRDGYGVPHIYGQTDADTAYGLAWAHAEDDFETIQKAYLAGNGLLTKHLGLKGAPADFLSQMIESHKTVEDGFDTLSPAFVKVLKGYAQGLNAFAAKRPKEVLVKDLFPITPKKILAYSQLQLFVSNRADELVGAIVANKVPVNNPSIENDTQGSNLIALSSVKTGLDETYLAINTHQPLEGPTSWYEAHLVSEEGTNIIGATFAGAPCILTGANQFLGWTHTVNYPDKADIYALEMHPKKKNVYLVDNKEYRLKKKKAKLYLKLLGMYVPIAKKFYTSIYGPTLKNKKGFFSVRTPSTTNIDALEQWWMMNKASSFSDFYSVLEKNAIPGYNIGYADRNDTIFYISNGKIPKRSPDYQWRSVVPGNTMKTLWNTYYTTAELPQVIAPKAGFVYNANHSPFKSTDPSENPSEDRFTAAMGFEKYDNNRSTRLLELLIAKDTLNYEAFKTIKYDRKLPTPLKYNFLNIDALFEMNPDNYPDVKEVLVRIQLWDRLADADSFGAGAYAILYYHLGAYYNKLGPSKTFNPLLIYTCLKNTKAYMLKHFKTTNVRLGDFQKLVRGDTELPIYGLPDVVTAMRGEPHKNGKIKITHGESYIGLVRFTPEKTYYESVISYGNSERPDSPHYDDQMELYQNFEAKPMYFDRESVLKTAHKIYHPK